MHIRVNNSREQEANIKGMEEDHRAQCLRHNSNHRIIQRIGEGLALVTKSNSLIISTMGLQMLLNGATLMDPLIHRAIISSKAKFNTQVFNTNKICKITCRASWIILAKILDQVITQASVGFSRYQYNLSTKHRLDSLAQTSPNHLDLRYQAVISDKVIQGIILGLETLHQGPDLHFQFKASKVDQGNLSKTLVSDYLGTKFIPLQTEALRNFAIME